jgi:hypothetical protein
MRRFSKLRQQKPKLHSIIAVLGVAGVSQDQNDKSAVLSVVVAAVAVVAAILDKPIEGKKISISKGCKISIKTKNKSPYARQNTCDSCDTCDIGITPSFSDFWKLRHPCDTPATAKGIFHAKWESINKLFLTICSMFTGGCVEY